jgi:hypothetical protein
MTMPFPDNAPLSDEDKRRIAEHEEALADNQGPCQYVDEVSGARCEVSSISHDDVGADHDYSAPASKVLGDPGNDLPPMVVADDVAYIDADGEDVTDDTINRNMGAAVRDLTERG